MSDLDRGAVLLHLWKRQWEGPDYATAEYPCKYIEHPTLMSLTRGQACAHAVAVGVDDETMFDMLGEDEHTRLYDLALTTGRQVLESRLMWGVRWANDAISAIESQDVAEAYVADARLAALELLHRDVPGGAWQVVRDMRGHTETVTADSAADPRN